MLFILICSRTAPEYPCKQYPVSLEIQIDKQDKNLAVDFGTEMYPFSL